MLEAFIYRWVDEETTRQLVSLWTTSGYGVTVRGRYNERLVTVFAPDDGEAPLPWSGDVHMLATQARELVRRAQVLEQCSQ